MHASFWVELSFSVTAKLEVLGRLRIVGKGCGVIWKEGLTWEMS